MSLSSLPHWIMGYREVPPDSEEIMDAATIAKINRDKQIQAEIDRREAAEASRKRIGFLAQDIQKVLPELVQTDENGMMSIDYIGFYSAYRRKYQGDATNDPTTE